MKNKPTMHDLMQKLLEMDKKYDILFTKYEEQILINKTQQNEIKQLKRQLDLIKKEKNEDETKNNVIITGIPILSQYECPNEVVANLEEHLDKNETRKNCYRLGKRIVGTSPPIKIEFANEQDKREFVKVVKQKKINTKDLGYDDFKRIYVNEDLTKEKQLLFKIVRQFKRDNKYKFAWIGGKGKNVFLRRNETSKCVQINSKEDLLRLDENNC